MARGDAFVQPYQSLQTPGHCSHRLCLQSAHVSRRFTMTTKLHHDIINIKLTSNAIAQWTETELTS